jgi:hypothetical protein
MIVDLFRRTMDNVQNYDSYINIQSLQTYRLEADRAGYLVGATTAAMSKITPILSVVNGSLCPDGL